MESAVIAGMLDCFCFTLTPAERAILEKRKSDLDNESQEWGDIANKKQAIISGN